MADSFFGIDTSLSNLNDDEGGGGPSEDEYDALNDETFGQADEYDWEQQHEQLAEQIESSRRHNQSISAIDESQNSRLEESLSQLVLDETDAPSTQNSFSSSVWRHDPPPTFPSSSTPMGALGKVCTVEELERQLRQKQPVHNNHHNYFQPRFPVILQRPPGLQGPVPLPYAPQQSMTNMNQPINKIVGSNQMAQNIQMMHNQMGQNINQIGQGINQIQNMNQMGQNINPIGPNINQIGQNMNQMGQNINQMGQNVNQFLQNSNQMGNFQNQMGQNSLMGPMNQNMHQINQTNQMGQNMNQMGQNINHMNQMGPNINHLSQNQLIQNNQMIQNNQLAQNSQIIQNTQIPQNNHIGPPNLNSMGQNMNPMGQNINQMAQNMNQMGQNMNQMGPNMSQMAQNFGQMGSQMPNGNQFVPNSNFQHGMAQPRMMGPPPGMSVPRQNFSPTVNQFNQSFRAPPMTPKPEQPINQNMMINHQPMMQSKTQPINQMISQPINQQISQPINQPISQPINQSTPMKQQMTSPQNKSTPQKPAIVNSPIMKTEPRTQKSRVYNNKSLTSQNLVQLIQNTHPMLQQYNSSYHNASHHPILNNRSNFNNQFNNHPLFNSQNLNGSFNSNSSMMNGDEDSACSDSDEYSGLMTSREKQWLINIQMLQLNTATPYIHDYYYTVFLERQARKEKEGVKEAHKANQQNHPFYSGGVKQETHRERHNSNRHNSTSEDAAPRTYVPTQFENSLGKLQCGSVTAPRKIIDVELVPAESGRISRAGSVASIANPNEVPKEMRRTKQLLLDIEGLYLILLRLEELNDPLAISNALILKEREEKQKLLEAAQKELEDQDDDSNVFLRNIESVQRRPKQESPKSETIDKRQVVNLAVSQKPAPVKNLLDEDKEDLVGKMFAGLLHNDRIAQMMQVRKGRALLCRFLSRVSGGDARLRGVWSRILRALSSAARRDTSGLVELWRHYVEYIKSSTGWSAVLESCSILTESLDPARTHYVLTTPLTLSCVCTLLEKASTLVHTPDATSSERQWLRFLKTVTRALKNTNLLVARPLQPLAESKLSIHIKQLESRNTIEILQRGKSTADFADLSKGDLSEQLLKHLC